MSTKHLMTLFLSTKQKKWLSVSCILILIFIANNFVFPAQASAAAAPGGNISDSVVSAVDIDKPAIVRILTILNGSLTVNFSNSASVTFPRSGGIYKLELSGSGAFISSHGDILTADHVINPPHDKSTDNFIQSLAADDIATYINQTFNPNIPYSSDEVYASLAAGTLPSKAHYDAPQSTAYLSTDYTGLINATTLASIPQNISAPINKIEGSSPVDKNDVAIVHVQMEDTPSIHIGDSSNVSEQDNLTIIGFPGNADLDNSNNPDPNTFLASSINRVYVSSIKPNFDNSTLIQVGGNVEHGDSGGPALDKNGDIVGVVSFLSSNADTPVGTSFLQASNSAQSVIDTLPSLDLTPGKFQNAWAKAFKQYTATSSGHWHQADSSFLAIQKNYPDFQAIAAFKDYTAVKAKQEQQPQSSSLLYLLLFLIAAVVIILALTWFFLSRHKKNQLALAIQNPMHYAPNASPTPNFYNSSNYAQPGSYAQPQPGNYPPSQPGSYAQAQPGSYPPSQSGSYAQVQPGNLPQPQPGNLPQPQPGNLPQPQPQPGNYPQPQPGNLPQPQPSNLPQPQPQPGNYPQPQPSNLPQPQPQPNGNEMPTQRSTPAPTEQVAPPVASQATVAETSRDNGEEIPTIVANRNSQPAPAKPTPVIETNFDASVPLIAPDVSRNANPYAPQPISWQAFQELGTHNPADNHKPESYQRREEPTIYAPLSDEQTELARPDQSANEENLDSTDKHPSVSK